MNVYDLIRQHEGLRLKPYRCTAGKLTIGYGHNLDDNGISERQADDLLLNDLVDVEEELLCNLKRFEELDEIRQAVLLDMSFNLGWPRLSGFKKTLAYMEAGDYKNAAHEMLDSQWARQVGERANRLSRMMETGEWPQ